ncbi:MAG TPA: Rrf2 family transcriptional regulator [Ignavibacteria bacterium]|nr:Rrf2 family transcriptional regulator [Ignavibacteria bacterium]HRF64430.1 Rrf2 family transcriptional regulator [Ignavibacteria bacterium]HRJ04120.1 Rrf2 family transcriptional regulator [Ignavibacteria bacterium]HRJ86621.1 Rrf2 family transcriptional regulator [Ignavibacteria bacterium]
MKFSTQEEYGLRCLLRVAGEKGEKGLTIPEISKAEGITTHNTAKILRALRLGGFLASSRGQIGGYTLSRPADEILVKDVLDFLGGKLFDAEFCNDHSGSDNICTHSVDCSIRSLWQMLQNAVDGVLKNMTIKDLLAKEDSAVTQFASIGIPESIKI